MPHPLHQAAATARHDLGKAICLNSRWLTPNPTDDDLREALKDDLERTRQSRQGIESAPALWTRLRPTLAPLGDDEDLQRIDQSIATIAATDLDQASRPQLQAARDAAQAVAEALARLTQRLQEP